MTNHDVPGRFSLKRWSRRKLEATRAAAATPPARAEPLPSVPPTVPGATGAPAPVGHDAAGNAAPAPLPPVDSLVFDSDFTPFLQPKVDEGVKREALKKLFSDPRFNVMDRLDVYIDDYSLPDPIAPEVARQLLHMQSFFAPPKTRVNAQGFVEDVPADEGAAPPVASALPVPDDTMPPVPASPPDAPTVRSTKPDDVDPIQRDNEHPQR
jgi:hypothetical protein